MEICMEIYLLFLIQLLSGFSIVTPVFCEIYSTKVTPTSNFKYKDWKDMLVSKTAVSSEDASVTDQHELLYET